MSPYFIEPYAVGQTTHVIGHDNATGKMRTLKIERIERLELTNDRYEIPADFDPRNFLSDAWGIWYTEKEPVEVMLKFHPRVALRVRETRWHRSEGETELSDGSILWKAKIAEPQEMVPWIRAWGADCEVVEPKELRDELMKEARRMAKVYGVIGEKTIPAHWLLWAKTNRPQNTKLHLLICHLIDVGNVAKVMWEHVFTNEFKQQIADALNLKNPDEAGRLIAFIAATHDLGKACPHFQAHISNKPALKSHYEEIVKEFGFPGNKESCLHGFVSTAALVDLLQSTLKMPRELAIPIAIAVGGHHGRWPTSNEWGDQSACAGGDVWKDAREKLVVNMREIFDPPNVTQYALDQETQNMLLVALSGITSVTDWLGSMENHFGYVESIDDLEKYALDSRGIAEKVLEKEGWTKWQPPTDAMTFPEQFENKTPRGAQPFIVEELAGKLNAPSLVIIEDATGSGKTEAAWYLADHWTRMLGNRGAYVAMPTMATSNSLHKRVNKFLEARYPDADIKAILVHSQARYAEDDSERRMQSNDDADQSSKGSEVNALAWFEDKRKRSLLTPFGVGTADQTFLSVLQTNHFFVRLFALGRKTVIFDEVHAYDTYMTEIFQTLLRWLRVMGSSAIILSATLPDATRRKLVEAYGGDASKASDAEASSVVTWVSGTTTGQKPLQASAREPVRVEWIEHSPEAIAKRLHDEMREGGCVAVICNRVARAQEVYRAIKDAFKDDARFIPTDNLRLFHARFPMVWRDEIEKSVLAQADKESRRERPFIVVATQVIEQSLDLDFDLMITDLPPMDLLIQRVGRLHRHKEHDGLRSDAMKTPRVLITKPEKEGKVPRFGKDEFVYSYYVLLRTWLEMKSREQSDMLVLELPKQTREVIEAVYVEGKPNLDSTLFTDNQKNAVIEGWKKMRRNDEEEKRKANLRTIDDPGSESLITMDNLELSDDESPQAQEGLQMTATQPPSRISSCSRLAIASGECSIHS
ncbi:MAG: CRISPR-associated helicase Cas3', partial [Chloroflexi bacterium]|nr:CRISPR-associated helicase Cas3' [Chloroflexota bacterium]